MIIQIRNEKRRPDRPNLAKDAREYIIDRCERFTR